MHHFTVPKLTLDHRGRFYVSFRLHGRRRRYANGRAFNLDLDPNRLPPDERKAAAEELCYLIHGQLREGWGMRTSQEQMTALEAVRSFTVDASFTPSYQKALRITQRRFVSFIEAKALDRLALVEIEDSHIRAFLMSLQLSVSSYNHELKHIGSILSKLLAPLGKPNPASLVKKKKEKPQLHKPFKDVSAVLEEIRSFNENLWLCCLLTYGCLLRPHQEIRQLTWGDFSEDMTFIALSGRRNKSGRTRIVPLNPAIAVHLRRGRHTDNIFTGSDQPYNPDYFKTLWGKFKRCSRLLKSDQTLYSFRHAGAIEVYKRTASLDTLQRAMGHADLKTTLGYLRNLEVPTLQVEEMPQFNH